MRKKELTDMQKDGLLALKFRNDMAINKKSLTKHSNMSNYFQKNQNHASKRKP